MDQPETSLSPARPSQSEPEMSEQLAGVRGVLSVLLVAVFCLALGAALTLYRQVSLMGGQLAEVRRLVEDYQNNTFPKISAFAYSLNQYAKTNPDFMPILVKYKLTINEAPATATGSAPAGPAAKK